MIPTLQTERLTLRPPSPKDLDADAEFYASDRARFVGGPLTREMTWRYIATTIGHWTMRGFGRWAVDERAAGTYCGQVGLWYPEGWPEAEVGWSLHAHAEGRGIAREAAEAALDYAWNTLGWTTCISLIDPANERSIRLAERLGATYDGPFTHERFGEMGIWRYPGPDGRA